MENSGFKKKKKMCERKWLQKKKMQKKTEKWPDRTEYLFL